MAVLLFAFSTLASAEATISFGDNAIKARAGKVFTLDVLMSDFPVTEGGGLVLHYNPNKLQVLNVTIDSGVWQFVNKNGDIDNQAGVVTGILFSSYQGVASDARIATIEFQAINKGKSKIRLAESEENPFSSNGQKLQVKFNQAKVRTRR